MIYYELLLSCFRSGQMSVAQMQGHMRDDPDFAKWIAKQ